MRKIAFALGFIALLSTPARATDFVVDGTGLPSTKTDITPRPSYISPTQWFGAGDYNALMQGEYDLRSAITGVTPGFALRLNDGASTAVSAVGTGAIRYNGTTHLFEQSLNGGAWSSTLYANGIDRSTAGTFTLAGTNATAIQIGHLDGTANSTNYGSFIMQAQPSTSGTALRDSPPIVFQSRYWSTSDQAVNSQINVVQDSTTPTYHLSVQLGGSEKFKFDSAGTLYTTAGHGLDTSSAGTLNLGTSTATSVQVQSIKVTGSTVDVSTVAPMALGGANATAISIGNATNATTLIGYGRTYTQFYADGGFYVDQVPDATSGTTTKPSPILVLRGKYWNGSASLAVDNNIATVVQNTTPASYIQLATQGKLLAWDSTGSLWQGTDASGKLGLAATRWGSSYVVDSYTNTLRATAGGSEIHVIAAAGTPGTDLLGIASSSTYGSLIWPIADGTKASGGAPNRWGNVWTLAVSSGDTANVPANGSNGASLGISSQVGGRNADGGNINIVANAGGAATPGGAAGGNGGNVVISSGNAGGAGESGSPTPGTSS
jgi:hypothetical protein